MARLSDYQQSDWQRLSRSIWAARSERGWTDMTVWARETGLSLPTLRKLDHGRPVMRETLVTVSVTLGWPELRAEQILADRHAPTGVEDAASDDLLAELKRRLQAADLLAPGRPLRLAEVRELDQFVAYLLDYREERAASEIVLGVINRVVSEVKGLLAGPPADESDE